MMHGCIPFTVNIYTYTNWITTIVGEKNTGNNQWYGKKNTFEFFIHAKIFSTYMNNRYKLCYWTFAIVPCRSGMNNILILQTQVIIVLCIPSMIVAHIINCINAYYISDLHIARNVKINLFEAIPSAFLTVF